MVDLPTMLEAAWNEPGPVRRGLSRDRIVGVAIELVDAEGLGALSMAKVAARLGFTAMSLYRHVRSKDELVLLMQDVAIGPPPDGNPAVGWRPALERWTWEALARFRAHPWILATISMFGPPATPNQLAWLERGLQTLASIPLTEPEKLTTMLLLDAHVFADVQLTTFGTPTATEVADPADFGAVLVGLLDTARFPAILRAVDGGAFSAGPDPVADRDSAFGFGLARILDGIEQLVRERGGQGAG